jgi:hypothetical protein
MQPPPLTQVGFGATGNYAPPPSYSGLTVAPQSSSVSQSFGFQGGVYAPSTGVGSSAQPPTPLNPQPPPTYYSGWGNPTFNPTPSSNSMPLNAGGQSPYLNYNVNSAPQVTTQFTMSYQQQNQYGVTSPPAPPQSSTFLPPSNPSLFSQQYPPYS